MSNICYSCGTVIGNARYFFYEMMECINTMSTDDINKYQSYLEKIRDAFAKLRKEDDGARRKEQDEKDRLKLGTYYLEKCILDILEIEKVCCRTRCRCTKTM